MTVLCQCTTCPYYSEGFCVKKGFVTLNASGLCSHVYDKNNQAKPNWNAPVDISEKDFPIIVEGAV